MTGLSKHHQQDIHYTACALHLITYMQREFSPAGYTYLLFVNVISYTIHASELQQLLKPAPGRPDTLTIPSDTLITTLSHGAQKRFCN